MTLNICLLIASVCVLILTITQIMVTERIEEIERKLNRLLRYKK